MKETRLIKRFSEKSLIWGNGPFWAQKLLILITLDSFSYLHTFYKPNNIKTKPSTKVKAYSNLA